MINKAELFQQLPSEWPTDLLPTIQAQVAASGRKIVVLDDDPTGTQTVYNVGVLTTWTVDALAAELRNPDPCVYILTNSRSLPLPAAQKLNAEIGRNLLAAAQQTGRPFAVVSRSDSTLRGHYPGETDALAATLGMQVDATLLIPFFLEGGRFTINDVHYVAEGEQLIPAAETPFARDAAFGYHHSNLREWVAEKSAGRVAADQVAAITLEDIRQGGPVQVTERLLGLHDGAVCIINAASMRDVQVFVLGLLAAEAQGKIFLYRTAASFVQVRAGINPRPLLTADELQLPTTGGGLIVVGSYVPKTTGQLGELLATPGVTSVEISVAALLDDARQTAEINRVAQAIDEQLQHDQDVTIYTSRDLVTGSDAGSSLAIGQRVSESLVAIVRQIRQRPRYLLAKGGITSSDVATQGLEVQRATVLGQILPGVPVWHTGPESRLPDLVYIVFPGNVGDNSALSHAVQTLRPPSRSIGTPDLRTLVKQQFGASAAAYATSKVHAQGASLKRLVELVQPQATWQALDVATAAGHTAFAFAPHVAHVVASDLTPEMLPVAAKVGAEKGISNVNFQEADAEALPFADESFDLVTCRIAPHHFADVDRFLGESARVLRPGGILAVVDNIVPGSEEDTLEGMELRAAGAYINDIEKLRDPSHARCLSRAEWISAFQRAGFTVLHDETAPKAMEFEDWARRMVKNEETLAGLRQMFLTATGPAAEFLTVTPQGSDLVFYLSEVIVVGRKQ